MTHATPNPTADAERPNGPRPHRGPLFTSAESPTVEPFREVFEQVQELAGEVEGLLMGLQTLLFQCESIDFADKTAQPLLPLMSVTLEKVRELIDAHESELPSWAAETGEAERARGGQR